MHVATSSRASWAASVEHGTKRVHDLDNLPLLPFHFVAAHTQYIKNKNMIHSNTYAN